MTFLINCSNLKTGGGLQVADSICCQLNRFVQHKFIVVLSPYMKDTEARLSAVTNVEIFIYEVPNSLKTVLVGRDVFLDSLVKTNLVAAVLTVFGPSRWKPYVPHLSGFAMPHLVIPESPFFMTMSQGEKVKWSLWRSIRTWSFRHSAKVFWTENSYISKRLERIMVGAKVFTVSNYYNQVYDRQDMWRKHPLPIFEGVTCLSVSSFYPHKNFQILVEAVKELRRYHPDFRFRFILTFDKGVMQVPEDLQQHFVFTGKVDVSECPDLYRQADIMVMPSLLECFTATYPEAMRMEVPIVTTDLEFARGLCGDAACYYCAVDAKACAEAIYRVATDKEYAAQLVANGKRQLMTYDNYKQRADKLVRALEEISTDCRKTNS